ncbi:hypothetical protein BH10PSE19_BH10PSE19_14590 [soil metagenome]
MLSEDDKVREYSKEFKEALVNKVIAEPKHSMRSVATEAQIGISTLYKWVRECNNYIQPEPNYKILLDATTLLTNTAHAVNALSEFTKTLKQWIKEQGCSVILKIIKETIFNPWLPKEWYEQQHKNPVQLKLQLE